MRARVNHSTTELIEVGVRVEAWAVGGPVRHINTIYLELSSHGKIRPLLSLGICQDPERARRYAKAVGRRTVRSLRSSIRIRSFVSSIELNEVNRLDVCLTNVGNAHRLRAAPFQVSQLHIEGIRASYRVENEDAEVERIGSSGLRLCRAVEGVSEDKLFLEVKMWLPDVWNGAEVLQFVADPAHRHEWDTGVESYKVHHELPETEDTVLRMVRKLSGAGPQLDMMLLRSIRHDSVNGIHLAAYRSISLPGEPSPAEGLDLGNISSASYFVEPFDGGHSLRYIIHVPNELHPDEILEQLTAGALIPESWVAMNFASLVQLRKILLQNFAKAA
mmetsp:Transcript_26600/g.79854  ORF Transcript_26600/g.79854 Transcript_26600/m.79854 type:complete len:332 (+) Transcript_26600:860-1855(+)